MEGDRVEYLPLSEDGQLRSVTGTVERLEEVIDYLDPNRPVLVAHLRLDSGEGRMANVHTLRTALA